jgi:hypothetical protein
MNVERHWKTEMRTSLPGYAQPNHPRHLTSTPNTYLDLCGNSYWCIGEVTNSVCGNPSTPPRLQVNRGTCRFRRYKNPRRPHPPPRASRVSHHPPQVSGLTLAHPCSPTLTRPRPPPPARPIDSGYAGPFLAPGQRDRNGLPRRCRFWIATHRMVD